MTDSTKPPNTTGACYLITPGDNVATALNDLAPGYVCVHGSADINKLHLRDNIKIGHKVTITAVRKDEPIIKFGVPIGHATIDIPAGTWVHMHNCASNYDARSQTLDLDSGAATDTAYV